MLSSKIFAIPPSEQDQSIISVTRDQPEFVIKLNSNPTTGYSWQLSDYDKSKISPVTHRYVASDSGLIGAPGYELWTFRAKTTAFDRVLHTKIKFDYVRPWEPKNVVKRAQYDITSE